MPVYDLEVISIIKTLPNDAVCIDVGVNEGQLFSFMVNHCFEGKVYGFEPIPSLYTFLVNSFSRKTVQLYPYILSDKEETTTFYHFPSRTGVSGMSRRDSLLPELKVEEIRSSTHVLDHLLNLPRVDLIKIDVEGAELKVLQGSKQHIIRCKPIVVFECQNNGLDYFNTTAELVFDFFWELGYEISLTKYYLQDLPPLDRDTLLNLVKYRFEYQFVAFPNKLKAAN